MEKIKMTKKDVRRVAGNRPVLSADYLVSCYLKEKGFQPIGHNCGSCGCNFDIYEIGNAIICAGYHPGEWDGEITKTINQNDRKNKTAERVISDLADSIKVKGGYKTWGWLAEELIKSDLLGKPFRAIFRPYHQYSGNYARRSYYKIPKGLNDVCERLGIAYELKNDAPRGGKAGDYLEFKRKKYYIAYDYAGEFSGEVLAVTTNKRHALDACSRRKDETEGECYTGVETVESKEDALKIARKAEKRGYAPILEVER